MHQRAGRDVLERQRVAGLDVGGRAGLDHGADAEALRGDDVGLGAVDVVEQRDPRRPVGVVLDRGDLGGNTVLVRLKSITRYWRLWPPPWWRVVMRPLLFRPPFFFSGSVRLFSGAFFVTSSNEETAMKRRPGLVGLYFLTAI